jgi:hypothetical protein
MGEIEVRSEALRPSADAKFSINVLAPQPYNRGAGCEKSLSSGGYQKDGALLGGSQGHFSRAASAG